MASFYTVASKFAHPTALLLHRKEDADGMLDSFYEIGAKSALTCLRHMEQSIQNDYPDFRYQLAASARQ